MKLQIFYRKYTYEVLITLLYFSNNFDIDFRMLGQLVNSAVSIIYLKF